MLITSTQYLRSYFQAHPIVVLTDQPLRPILQCPDTSGRMAKWAIKLDEFDILYRLRMSIKGQTLADFLIECAWPDDPPTEEPKMPSTEPSDLGLS